MNPATKAFWELFQTPEMIAETRMLEQRMMQDSPVLRPLNSPSSSTPTRTPPSSRPSASPLTSSESTTLTGSKSGEPGKGSVTRVRPSLPREND